LKSLGLRFNDCEFIDCCYGVADRDPHDQVMSRLVGQQEDDSILGVGFVLVNLSLGVVQGYIGLDRYRASNFDVEFIHGVISSCEMLF